MAQYNSPKVNNVFFWVRGPTCGVSRFDLGLQLQSNASYLFVGRVASTSSFGFLRGVTLEVDKRHEAVAAGLPPSCEHMRSQSGWDKPAKPIYRWQIRNVVISTYIRETSINLLIVFFIGQLRIASIKCYPIICQQSKTLKYSSKIKSSKIKSK